MTQKATDILNTLRSDLKREKEAFVALLKDPNISEWNAIDYKKIGPLLSSAGIDVDTIKASLPSYQQQAKKIGKQIGDWNIEIGNQLADCIDSAAPETALASANKLAEKILGLTAMKEELQGLIRPLLAATHCLRKQLNINSLISVAKIVAPGKKDQIQMGASIIPLLIDKSEPNEEGLNLLALCQEPERLEARYRHLVVPRLPRLIEEVLFHHIENSLSTIREIKIFLDNIAERMEREIIAITTIEKSLLALHAESPNGLIKGILAQGQIFANLLSALYHKQNLLGAMNTAAAGLDTLSIFCNILKNRIVPGLKKEVEITGSPLNPISISSRRTRSFFEGTSGIIRSLKLMMKSLKGQAAVNEIELQQILEKGITSCNIFFSSSPADLNKIKYYIDSMIAHYPHPFPYNDLFKLAKATLLSYAAEVEKFIADHEIPKDMPVKTAPSHSNVGQLISALDKYKITFQKANADT